LGKETFSFPIVTQNESRLVVNCFGHAETGILADI